MTLAGSLLFAVLAVGSALAQTSPATATSTTSGSNATGVSATSVLPELDKLQAAATQANMQIGHLRIEKWKADGDSKKQAQSNADSVQRNLTSALPGMIDAVRATPQDLSAQFKLYRNLNALYDVMGVLTESAGAFGSKTDYEALAQQLQVIDSVRRDLGDVLEGLTSSTQSELNQLRAQVRAQQQAATAAAPPKKVVVDDTQPAKKTAHKKKPVSSSGSDSSTTPQAPKP